MNKNLTSFILFFTLINSHLHTNSKTIILDTTPILNEQCNTATNKPIPQQVQGVVIVIHGTFASKEDWYLPGGAFLETLRTIATSKNYKVISFTWSGELSCSARIYAAKNLAQFIASYPASMKIILIGHSHGGNVINLASQLLYDPLEDTNYKSLDCFTSMALAMESDVKVQGVQVKNNTHDFVSIVPQLQKAHHEVQATLNIQRALIEETTKHRIECAYLLATPVNTKAYPPNYFVIKNLKNLYSLGDFIQTVAGTCDQTYPPHPQSINYMIQVKVSPEGPVTKPNHTEMHAPYMGFWLLDIFEELKNKKIGNFETCEYGIDGKITFFKDYSEPVFEILTNP